MNNSKEVFEMNTVSFNSLGDLGRLGNQMFQYAALISIAVSNGYNFLIPDPEKVNFKYYILQDTFRLNSIDKAKNYGISNFDNFINDKVTNDIEFHESYNNLFKNVNLHGYFQSYRFIEPVTDLIQKDFQFNEAVTLVAEKILMDEHINPKNYTFIHIRRGDYLSKKEYHYNLDKSYYKKSAGLFPDTTKFLVDSIIKYKKNISWFFFASSSHVYPFQRKKILEKSKTKPLSKYGKTKLLAENYIKLKFTNKNISFCIGRIFSIFNNKNEGFFTPSLLSKIKNGPRNLILENLNHYRDFLSTEQISKIIFFLWKKKFCGTINIASGIKTNLTDIAKIFAKKAKKKVLFKSNKSSFHIANISKLTKLGYKSTKLNFGRFFN